ncbi:MAG: NAD(P)H-binding protein [Candidatus Melainabacteria bacterium]|nr:NAD(P)H-binding protein [Candidatus Melainabacteria bacterium]
MRIAITGGSGFLGGHLAREMARRGHFPTIVARGVSPRGEALRKVANINFMPMPITDDRRLFQAFNNCDGIAHLIGINRETEPNEFHKVHVDATMRVISMARKAGIKRVIFVSYLKARKNPFSRYHQTKWEAEEMFRTSGLDYTILKPGMIYGPGDHMISHISRALDLLPLFSPPISLFSNKIRPISVDDMSDLMIRSFEEEAMVNQTVALLGPEEITLSEAVRRVARVRKKLALVLPLPSIVHYSMAAVMERFSADPLFTTAQINMLTDDMSKPLAGCDLPPPELQPKTYLTDEQIRAALDTRES